MTTRSLAKLSAILMVWATLGCSSDDSDDGASGTGGVSGGSGGDQTGGSGGGATGGSAGSATGGTGGATGGSAGSETGGTGGATGGSAGSETGGTGGATGGSAGSSTDPYAAARTACINKINELRATKGLEPYTQWTSAESCADGQVTSDEASGTGHGAFGQCGESAQNECLGGGAAGIESCLESMWAEKDQAGCSGCDACADAYNSSCPNCDFYGSETGDVCGHYVNMSAKYLSMAACGFSEHGGWAVIDFK